MYSAYFMILLYYETWCGAGFVIIFLIGKYINNESVERAPE